MNKHGQVIAYTMMLGTCIIILALALAPVLKERIDETRNASNLNCSSATISDYDSATCIVTDFSLFYFVGGLIFIAGAVITARILFG